MRGKSVPKNPIHTKSVFNKEKEKSIDCREKSQKFKHNKPVLIKTGVSDLVPMKFPEALVEQDQHKDHTQYTHDHQ